ncbi:hypothetical protein Goari_022116, partial [Gossypium aridum]|nr:hypothetical protein [Gossypium aridum]
SSDGDGVRGVTWNKQFDLAHNKASPRQLDIAPNLPLSGDWINLHTIRAVKLGAGFTATGGVVCELNEAWILGFNHYLGDYSVFDTELWGILNGLILLQRQGYVPREKNQVADCIVKMTSDKIEDVHVFVDALGKLRASLFADRINDFLIFDGLI